MHVPHGIRPQSKNRTLSVANATLPTKYGTFAIHVFRDDVPPLAGGDAKAELVEDETGEREASLPSEHVALVFGSIEGRSHVPVRVHSECMTSEVFGSLKCDCKEQLEHAMAEIQRRGFGAIVYLRQEGRGIGLANKIRAYALQSDGHDTVDANRLLGLPDDARRYDVARDMLAQLHVKSILLMTNNPEKVTQLTRLGIVVEGTLPVVVDATVHSIGYLEAKRARMAHRLPVPRLRVVGGDAE